jgi:recombination associated protein RdgC
MKLFKNLFLFRVPAEWATPTDEIERRLAANEFHPCGATQQKAIGFQPPREKNGPMLEVIGGQWIMKLTTETKTVPAQTLARRVDEIAAQIEQQTGRKPGKKHRKELKEQALLELLPMAFTKLASSLVWLDPQSRYLVVEASSPLRADDITTALVRALDMPITLVSTEQSPAGCMTYWLKTGEAPYQFSVDRECELIGCDEQRSVVRYGKHPLDVDNVREHITQGKVATKLALTWKDRISFVLTDRPQLKKVSFLDVVFEGRGDNQADEFDANMAITTGELGALIPDLLEALGGVQVQGGGEE